MVTKLIQLLSIYTKLPIVYNLFMDFKLSDTGFLNISLLLALIAPIGVISFLLYTLAAPFKGHLAEIYPKTPIHAATNQIYWGGFIEGPNTYGTNTATGKPY